MVHAARSTLLAVAIACGSSGWIKVSIKQSVINNAKREKGAVDFAPGDLGLERPGCFHAYRLNAVSCQLAVKRSLFATSREGRTDSLRLLTGPGLPV